MSAKNILVLGATGGTGRAVVAEALRRGHVVTALVRDPSKLTSASSRLRIVTGDARRDDSALLDAVRGQDAVISALGSGKRLQPNGLIATSTKNIVRAMYAQGVRRLIFTSSFGVGETIRDVPLVPKIFIRLILKDIYRDKLSGETLLRGSDLDWTLVYPTGLTDKPASGRCRAGERLLLRGFPAISRADVADFLLRQLDDSTYVKKGVMIST